MVETALEVVSWVLLLAGGLFGIIGGIGLIRFPDFYSRLHAGGITDTLCALLIIAGLIIQAGLALASVKLALILIFFVFTAPTARMPWRTRPGPTVSSRLWRTHMTT